MIRVRLRWFWFAAFLASSVFMFLWDHDFRWFWIGGAGEFICFAGYAMQTGLIFH